jgi:hypothetical protein
LRILERMMIEKYVNENLRNSKIINEEFLKYG